MNRLEEEIERARRYDQELSLAMIDLDHFAEVNNQYGHQKGDEVLQQLGQCLENQIRKGDIPARYGGEEFTVLLPHTAKREAVVVMERVRETFKSRSFEHDGEDFHVTVSVGLSALQSDDEDQQALISRADAALYEAKRSGRDQVKGK